MTRFEPPHVSRPEPGPGYRERWQWDSVAWGTHCVDCYPGKLPDRVYLRDGKVVREEQAGTFPTIVEGVPDNNPMGCQKGAAWSQTLYGQERVLHPLRRAGERGEGKWERVSWDEALTDIADRILDAIEESGPEIDHPRDDAGRGRHMAVWPTQRLARAMLGGLTTDVNARDQRLQPGHYLTWGKFNPAGSAGSEFHTELSLIWHSNPVYTQIPTYHYIAEARYQGAEVVPVAPDCSPSHIHADYFFPVRPAPTRPGRSPCARSIIEERLYNDRFVKEQTDLPLLVRLDTGRFLRESDLEEDGSRRAVLRLGHGGAGSPARRRRRCAGVGSSRPLTAGGATCGLKDGSRVEVAPAFELLASAAEPRLHAGEGVEDLRRQPRRDPLAGAQGRQQAHLHLGDAPRSSTTTAT